MKFSKGVVDSGKLSICQHNFFYLLHNYKQIRLQMSKNYKYQNNSTNYDMQYILTDMISTYMQKH